MLRSRDHAITAFIRLAGEMSLEEVTLERVAQDTGVTVRTLLRHFGSKESLVRAANEVISSSVQKKLTEEAPDWPEFISLIVDYMEEIGDYLVRFESEASHYPSLQDDIDRGRTLRFQGLERMMQDYAKDDLEAHERLLTALYAVTDIYVWKTLRRERGLSARDTALLMRDIVEGLLTHMTAVPRRGA